MEQGKPSVNDLVDLSVIWHASMYTTVCKCRWPSVFHGMLVSDQHGGGTQCRAYNVVETGSDGLCSSSSFIVFSTSSWPGEVQMCCSNTIVQLYTSIVKRNSGGIPKLANHSSTKILCEYRRLFSLLNRCYPNMLYTSAQNMSIYGNMNFSQTLTPYRK